jgi:hypothetical protein
VVSSPTATEESGAMGREIKSCQGMGWYIALEKEEKGKIVFWLSEAQTKKGVANTPPPKNENEF